MLRDVYDARKYIEIHLNEVSPGWRVVEDATVDTGYCDFDNKTITIHPFPIRGTHEDLLKWYVTLFHENLHPPNYPDFEMLKKYKTKLPLHFKVMNIVCDHNCELGNWGVYPGQDVMFTEFYNSCQDELITQIPKLQESPEQKLWSIFALAYLCRQEWQNLNNIDIKVLLKADNPSIIQHLDLLLVIKDKFKAHREPGQPNWDLAQEILRILKFPKMPEPPPGKGKGKGDPKDGSENGSESSDDGSDDSDEEGDANKQGSGDGEDDNDSKQSEEDLEINYEKFDGLLPKSDTGRETAGCTIKYDHYTVRDDPSKYIVDTPRITYAKSCSSSACGHAGGMRRIVKGNQLTKKIRNELKVLSRVKKHSGKRSGKLNRRSVIQVATGTSDKVFARTVNRRILDTSVSILIDSSGSMSREKMIHAFAAGVMVGQVLGQLKVPYEVISFSNGYWKGVNAPHNTVHKEFDEKVTVNELLKRCSPRFASNSNADGESILWAYQRLIQQKSQKKIMFVLSDGQPAHTNSNSQCIYEFTRYVIDDIEKVGLVDLYAVGIMTLAVKDYYSKYVIIQDASTLEASLLNLMKKSILKED